LLRSLYDRLMRLAGTRYAVLWLALEAFCEGIFFPIPPDLMLMPMVLANRKRSWIYAAVCLVASLCGGSVGYAIGWPLPATPTASTASARCTPSSVWC